MESYGVELAHPLFFTLAFSTPNVGEVLGKFWEKRVLLVGRDKGREERREVPAFSSSFHS